MSWRFRVLLVISLLVAVGSAWYKAHWDQEHQQLVPSLIVTQNVPAFSQLAPEQLGIRQVPRGAVDSAALQNPQQVIGRTTGVPLFAGEPVRPEKLVGDLSLQPGESALGLDTDLVRSAGGTIRRGDHVDVYLQQTGGGVPVDSPVAADVVVMEVRTATGQSVTTTEGLSSLPAVVVIKGSVAQVSKLAEAGGRGKLTLVRLAPAAAQP